MSLVKSWCVVLAVAAAVPPAFGQTVPPRPAAPASSPAATPPTSAATTAPAARATNAPPKAGARPAAGARAMDRLDLDATQITGNRELPKVMVVVPWKKSDIGDLVGKPINSLVDEALQPVDREVFRREVDYYGALAPDRPAAADASPSAAEAPPR